MSGGVTYLGSGLAGLAVLDELYCLGVYPTVIEAPQSTTLRTRGYRNRPLSAGQYLWRLQHQMHDTNTELRMSEHNETICPTTRAQSEQVILASKPHTILVCGWYWLLSKKIIDSCEQVVVLHDSLLPKYRGHAPLVWAMLNGEKEVGVTMFKATEGMDDGPVYAQRKIGVRENDTIGDLKDKVIPACCELVYDYLPRILGWTNGKLTPAPQDESKATYGAKRTPKDAFLSSTMTDAEKLRMIRAQTHPYAGAYYYVRDERGNSKKLTVWSAHMHNDVLIYDDTELTDTEEEHDCCNGLL